MGCYVRCKKTAIYVLDFFPARGRCESSRFRIVSPPAHSAPSLQAPGNFGRPGSAVRSILGAGIFLERKPLKFSTALWKWIRFVSSLNPHECGPTHAHDFTEMWRDGERPPRTEMMRREKSQPQWPGTQVSPSCGHTVFVSRCPLRFHRAEQESELHGGVTLDSFRRLSSGQAFTVLMSHDSFPGFGSHPTCTPPFPLMLCRHPTRPPTWNPHFLTRVSPPEKPLPGHSWTELPTTGHSAARMSQPPPAE